jgi:hypothetical protein
MGGGLRLGALAGLSCLSLVTACPDRADLPAACDEEHPCARGLSCIDGLCLTHDEALAAWEPSARPGGAQPAVDAGVPTDAGSDAGGGQDAGDDAGSALIVDGGALPEECGNGRLDDGEECDDGTPGFESFDGCIQCDVMFNSACHGEPSFCASESQVVSVGAGDGDLAEALATNGSASTFFLSAATYGAPLTITRDVNLIGPPEGAHIAPESGNAINVTSGGDVYAQGLTVSSSAAALRVSGASSRLRLLGVRAEAPCTRGANVLSDGSFEATALTVVGCSGSGVRVVGAGSLRIESSALVSNGTVGIDASQATGSVALRLNTIVGHDFGVRCADSSQTVRSSIVVDNDDDIDQCEVLTSLLGPVSPTPAPVAPDADGNVTGLDPVWVAPDDLLDGDVRIAASSPLVDLASPSEGPAYDFLLRPRPLGERYDVGAHEAR